MKSFATCFADLPDPRAENALHDLTELLFMALLRLRYELFGHGAVCADEGLSAGADPGAEARLPSHDTFSRVFRMLDPQAFDGCSRSS